MTIRTRFAPSPTGYLHVGGARTALFSWLHARKHGGRFILRIEDTDLERSSTESVNAILEGMNWLGLTYDEGPFFQTQRFDRYREVIDQLMASGHAYHCYCSKEELESMRETQMLNKEKPRYDGRCRHRHEPRPGVRPVVRFRNPDHGDVVIDDLIRGRIVISNQELDDLIIARSDGTPTYNLTVVVDDLDMAITQVIRGDDHINNTPRQINIIRALGAEPPRYAHVPMILGDDGKRLSKRHGAVSVMQYRDDGFLPEALLNYLVRLGWSHGDQEIFSLEEMIHHFEVTNVNNSASVFNTSKLIWLNQHYIKTATPLHIASHLSYHLGNLGIDPTVGPPITEVIAAYQERAKTLVELAEAIALYYRDLSGYDPAAAAKHLTPAIVEPLTDLQQRFTELSEWHDGAIQQQIQACVKAHNLKFPALALPLRVILTGSTTSPAIDVTVRLLGQPTTLARIAQGIDYIKKSPAPIDTQT
jgi:glutamyl-tRNA synthetase